MKAAASIVVAFVMVITTPGAHALCSYHGIDNAKTTISQEFRDSKWVVRAKVGTAQDHWADVGESWTTYELDVTQIYKGSPAERLRFFTYRDSGGFYMDLPWLDLPAGHDIGGEYLLFLNPNKAHEGEPREAKDAVFVNYACGRSGHWAEVRPSSRGILDALKGER